MSKNEREALVGGNIRLARSRCVLGRLPPIGLPNLPRVPILLKCIRAAASRAFHPFFAICSWIPTLPYTLCGPPWTCLKASQKASPTSNSSTF